MAEEFLDLLEVGAAVAQVGGGAVAEVVQPDRWQPAAGDEVVEAVADGFRVPGVAVGADEEQAGVGPVARRTLLPAGAACQVFAELGDGVTGRAACSVPRRRS